MTTSAAQEVIAEDLVDAYLAQRTYVPTDDFAQLDHSAATQVRDKLRELRERKLGDMVVGYKIALSTPPIVGYLFDRDVSERTEAKRARFLDPYLEPEVVFVIQEEFDPDSTDQEILSRCEARLGIEIADSRVENWFRTKTPPRLLADNCAAGAFVLGDHFVDGPPDVLTTKFHHGNDLVGHSETRLKDLLENVRFVTREVAKLDTGPLRPGQLIFSGTLTRPALPLLQGRYSVEVNDAVRVSLEVD